MAFVSLGVSDVFELVGGRRIGPLIGWLLGGEWYEMAYLYESHSSLRTMECLLKT
jgi:hypothetical protein